MPLIIEPPSEVSALREGRCPHCRTRVEKQEGGFLFVKNAIIKVNLKTRLAAAKCPQDRKSTRLNSSHIQKSRMPSSA